MTHKHAILPVALYLSSSMLVAAGPAVSYTTTVAGLSAAEFKMIGRPKESVWGSEHAGPVVELLSHTPHCIFLEVRQQYNIAYIELVTPS